MAELNTGGGGGKGKKVRSKKANPGVDLTAMVDLAFLLITFFILTTTLAKPQSMKLNLPDTNGPIQDGPQVPGWRTLTVVMSKDNKMLFYIGMTDTPEPGGEPKLVNYGGKKGGIREAILKHKEFVAQNVNDPKNEGLTVIIKATKKASYTNLVDILDEMTITKPKNYSVVDLTPGDEKMLADKGIK